MQTLERRALQCRQCVAVDAVQTAHVDAVPEVDEAVEAWPAAVWGEEDGAPEVFEGTGFGALLTGIVTGTIRPAAFPDDVWDEVPLTMEPLGSE